MQARASAKALADDPELDQKIENAFARVESFYYNLGFRWLPPVNGEESDYWVYCPWTYKQPDTGPRKPFRLYRPPVKAADSIRHYRLTNIAARVTRRDCTRR